MIWPVSGNRGNTPRSALATVKNSVWQGTDMLVHHRTSLAKTVWIQVKWPSGHYFELDALILHPWTLHMDWYDIGYLWIVLLRSAVIVWFFIQSYEPMVNLVLSNMLKSCLAAIQPSVYYLRTYTCKLLLLLCLVFCWNSSSFLCELLPSPLRHFTSVSLLYVLACFAALACVWHSLLLELSLL